MCRAAGIIYKALVHTQPTPDISLPSSINTGVYSSSLYVRQLSLDEPRPSAILPPVIHALYPVPQRLLVYPINLVLTTIQRKRFPLRDLNRGFVLAPSQDGISFLSTRSKENASAYLRSSSSSFRSGKNNLGSSTARIPSAARYRKESPSRMITSHIRAHASNGRWSKNSDTTQSGR